MVEQRGAEADRDGEVVGRDRRRRARRSPAAARRARPPSVSPPRVSMRALKDSACSALRSSARVRRDASSATNVACAGAGVRMPGLVATVERDRVEQAVARGELAGRGARRRRAATARARADARGAEREQRAGEQLAAVERAHGVDAAAGSGRGRSSRASPGCAAGARAPTPRLAVEPLALGAPSARPASAAGRRGRGDRRERARASAREPSSDRSASSPCPPSSGRSVRITTLRRGRAPTTSRARPRGSTARPRR